MTECKVDIAVKRLEERRKEVEEKLETRQGFLRSEVKTLKEAQKEVARYSALVAESEQEIADINTTIQCVRDAREHAQEMTESAPRKSLRQRLFWWLPGKER